MFVLCACKCHIHGIVSACLYEQLGVIQKTHTRIGYPYDFITDILLISTTLTIGPYIAYSGAPSDKLLINYTRIIKYSKYFIYKEVDIFKMQYYRLDDVSLFRKLKKFIFSR